MRARFAQGSVVQAFQSINTLLTYIHHKHVHTHRHGWWLDLLCLSSNLNQPELPLSTSHFLWAATAWPFPPVFFLLQWAVSSRANSRSLNFCVAGSKLYSWCSSRLEVTSHIVTLSGEPRGIPRLGKFFNACIRNLIQSQLKGSVFMVCLEENLEHLQNTPSPYSDNILPSFIHDQDPKIGKHFPWCSTSYSIQSWQSWPSQQLHAPILPCKTGNIMVWLDNGRTWRSLKQGPSSPSLHVEVY